MLRSEVWGRGLGFAVQELRCLDFVRARMRAVNSKNRCTIQA